MVTTPPQIKPTNLGQMVFIISMIAILVVSFSGYLYYSTIKKAAIAQTHIQAEENLKMVGNHIETEITNSKTAVNLLAQNMTIQGYVDKKNEILLSDVNTILDYYNSTIQAEVCYLMDLSGNTIASSNREATDSFVGKNFAFRPYFQKAIRGIPTVYMALGTLSKRRGIYFSYPVYRLNEAGPVGVVVIKTSVEPIQKNFENHYDGILLFTDPQGVIFISSKENLLYNILWPLPPKEIDNIIQSRQFGSGPFDWSGFKELTKNKAVDNQGNHYQVHRYDLENTNNYQLLYLHNEQIAYNKFIRPFNRSIGSSILILVFFFVIIILFLYNKIKNEINLRSKAEQKNENLILELQDSLTNVKQLSGMLPICASCKKIRDDKGYWNQIEHYIDARSEAQFSHGICPDCAKKLYPDIDLSSE